MSKRKKQKRVLIIFIILFIIIVSAVLLFLVFNKSEETKVVDEISKYSYSLDDRDTDLMKEHFSNLKTNLNSEEVNFEDYAKELSQLFIIDLYTLSNKNNKYDMGGLEYFHHDYVDNFRLKLADTLYDYFDKKSNTYPTVKSIEITDFKETTYKLNDKTYDGYVVSLKWDYDKDLGYDKKGTVTLIKDNDYIYIVKYEGAVS